MIIIPLIVASLVIGIATAGHEKQLRRKGYALRAAGLLIVYYIFGYVLSAVSSVELFIGTLPLHILIIVLGARWSAHRLNHIGQSRWWALSLSVPIINLLPIIALCLIPAQPEEALDADSGS